MKPAGHRDVGEDKPELAQNVPAVQERQKVAPVDAINLPETHLEQLTAENVENDPDPQGPETAVNPVNAQYDPARQFEQRCGPFRALNEPEAQDVHTGTCRGE